MRNTRVSKDIGGLVIEKLFVWAILAPAAFLNDVVSRFAIN